MVRFVAVIPAVLAVLALTRNAPFLTDLGILTAPGEMLERLQLSPVGLISVALWLSFSVVFVVLASDGRMHTPGAALRNGAALTVALCTPAVRLWVLWRVVAGMVATDDRAREPSRVLRASVLLMAASDLAMALPTRQDGVGDDSDALRVMMREDPVLQCDVHQAFTFVLASLVDRFNAAVVARALESAKMDLGSEMVGVMTSPSSSSS